MKNHKKISLIYWLIFFVSTTASVLAGVLLFFTNDKDMQSILTNILLMGIPVAIAELITIFHIYFEKQGKNGCTYKDNLEKIGILKVYETRDKEYVEDLSFDLNHIKSGINPTPIKMIGVSLSYYFDDVFTENLSYDKESIANILRIKSKKHEILALISNETNEELIRRNDLTQDMGYTCQNNRDVTADIQADIEKTISIVNNWIREDGALKIKFRKYVNAPYATIIFINDKIYYSPNLSFEKRKHDKREKRNPNIALLILRDSIYGKKLEFMFDIIWGKNDKNKDKYSKEVNL